MSIKNINKASYTEKQGQYLAFIYFYTKINGLSPAQTDFQKYFKVTPPTVHQMIMQLDKKKLITRIPNKARSIEIAILPELLPALI